MIVPFAAGGPTDVLARILASGCGTALGQTVVDRERHRRRRHHRRRPRGARAADGYTHQHRPPRHPCGQRRDLSAAVRPDQRLRADLADRRATRMLIVSKKALPAKDLKELIAWLKANPDKVDDRHRRRRARRRTSARVYFQNVIGTKFSSCRIAAPARRCRTWWRARSISIVRPGVELAAAGAQAARSRPTRVTDTKTRLAAAPDIPTVDEAGLPGFYVSVWYGAVGAEGHAEGRHREAQRRGASRRWPIPRCASGSPSSALDIPPREQQTPEALRALPEGRDREMVADHQGRRHQGGVEAVQGRR